MLGIPARQFEAGVASQQVTAPAIGPGPSAVSRRTMDIAEATRYDVRLGVKHDVGMGRDWSDARLVWIELGFEFPSDLLAVIVDSEAHKPVQVEYARHEDK